MVAVKIAAIASFIGLCISELHQPPFGAGPYWLHLQRLAELDKGRFAHRCIGTRPSADIGCKMPSERLRDFSGT